MSSSRHLFWEFTCQLHVTLKMQGYGISTEDKSFTCNVHVSFGNLTCTKKGRGTPPPSVRTCNAGVNFRNMSCTRTRTTPIIEHVMLQWREGILHVPVEVIDMVRCMSLSGASSWKVLPSWLYYVTILTVVTWHKTIKVCPNKSQPNEIMPCSCLWVSLWFI